jgi:hypothetical protein
LDGYQIPNSLQWKWIQYRSKMFKKNNLKMLRFKKSKSKSRKIKLHDLVLMNKKRYGTRNVYVFQSKRNQRVDITQNS